MSDRDTEARERTKELELLLKTLRAHGVTSYEGFDEGQPTIKLTLGPAPDTSKPEKPGVDPDLCKCGHAAFAHVNGLCTAGCEVEKCAPEEETP